MKQKHRIAAAGAIGNVLEWYDFGLYGLLAPVLATVFFPSHSRMASLLQVYGGFAVGFVMRPVGAVVLGHFGDRIGRRFVLVLSVTLMGVATVAVGLLPTYAMVGVWAPVLLILVRLLQGFSVGGEFVDSVTYLVEASSPRRRGIAGSIANVGSTAGMLLAAGVAAIVMSLAESNVLPAWAWRLPFLFGGLIACGAYYVRRHLPETAGEAEARIETQYQTPLQEAVRRDRRLLFICILFTSGYGIVNYLSMVFLPTFAHEFGDALEHRALRINTAGQALALVVVPLAGWFSDHVLTRRTVLASAFALEVVLAWKAFSIAGEGSHGLWLAQLTLAFLLALVMGTAPAMLAEQFPPGYRVSAHAVTLNVGIGIAGGTAPMVALSLIKATGSRLAPAAYLAFGGAISAIAVLGLRDRSRESLD